MLSPRIRNAAEWSFRLDLIGPFATAFVGTPFARRTFAYRACRFQRRAPMGAENMEFRPTESPGVSRATAPLIPFTVSLCRPIPLHPILGAHVLLRRELLDSQRDKDKDKKARKRRDFIRWETRKRGSVVLPLEVLKTRGAISKPVDVWPQVHPPALTSGCAFPGNRYRVGIINSNGSCRGKHSLSTRRRSFLDQFKMGRSAHGSTESDVSGHGAMRSGRSSKSSVHLPPFLKHPLP